MLRKVLSLSPFTEKKQKKKMLAVMFEMGPSPFKYSHEVKRLRRVYVASFESLKNDPSPFAVSLHPSFSRRSRLYLMTLLNYLD